ncbi:MAG: sugar phosphate isomerase/epimerase [Candidatus Sulfotelmatobacter sp.]|jgi:sugar phosphate isomerase/epimerase
MIRISRRTFLKTASASAACAALWNSAPQPLANALGLPLGLQLYSVRDVLPKDYDGTLHQLAALGYREVEAAGFFGHPPAEVKQAMDGAGLRCVSAHYPLKDLLPKVDETIQFGKDLGLHYIVCASPMLKDPSRVKDPGSRAARESMTLDDWRWNADQFNHIGEKVNAAGMRFAYHNHTPEFRSENGVVFYDELLRLTDPAKVTMELDCGWAVVAGQKPAELLSRYPTRFSMLHVKDFKMTAASTPADHPPSTEMGHGNIDYRPIFGAAEKAHIEHAFVEQEEFDMPQMQALKIDADYMRAIAG